MRGRHDQQVRHQTKRIAVIVRKRHHRGAGLGVALVRERLRGTDRALPQAKADVDAGVHPIKVFITHEHVVVVGRVLAFQRVLAAFLEDERLHRTGGAHEKPRSHRVGTGSDGI